MPLLLQYRDIEGEFPHGRVQTVAVLVPDFRTLEGQFVALLHKLAPQLTRQSSNSRTGPADQQRCCFYNLRLVCHIKLAVGETKTMSFSAVVFDIVVGDVASVLHNRRDWMMCLFAP